MDFKVLNYQLDRVILGDRQTDRETETERHRESERKTHTETERYAPKKYIYIKIITLM